MAVYFCVLSGIVIGTLGIWAAAALVQGKPYAYRNAIIVLLTGLHMATSRALRGSSMPKDFIVYATALTLIVYLLFRIPGIWQRINLDRKDDHSSSLGAGASLIVCGIVALTVQFLAGPSHIINGVNYADVWHTKLAIFGWLTVLLGSTVLWRFVLRFSERLLPAQIFQT